MEQGKHFAQSTDQNFAKNLAIAGQYFTKAQSLLSPSSDPAAFVLVVYQLMHVEFQKAEIPARLGTNSGIFVIKKTKHCREDS